MDHRYFYNADGEMLLVPQQNVIRVFTECGLIDAEPGEIVLIPKGMKFKVDLPNGPARGYPESPANTRLFVSALVSGGAA